MIKNRKIATMN